MLPNFFILGAAKCGTSALNCYLSQHPQFAMARPKEPPFFAASVVSSVFMPRLSRAYAQKRPSLMALAAKGGGLLVILGIVCTAGIWLFAAPVIELFYGQDFDASSQTLRILSYGLPLAFVAYLLQTLLISTDKPTRAFIVALIGLLFNGALNFYLIPRYGQEGAAWTTVISIVFVVICLLVVVGAGEYRKQVDKRVEPAPCERHRTSDHE